jgi:hypothetical protein
VVQLQPKIFHGFDFSSFPFSVREEGRARALLRGISGGEGYFSVRLSLDVVVEGVTEVIIEGDTE